MVWQFYEKITMFENYSVNSSPQAKESPPEQYFIAVTVP